MPRWTAITAIALLSLPLIAPSADAKTERRTWNREFQVTRQPTIRIKTEEARVVVRSWKESRVSVRVETRIQTAGLYFGSLHPSVEIAQQGNEVRIAARIDGNTTGFMFSSDRIEVEVWLPRESDLVVDSGDGPVTVEDLAGRIELDTEDGPLTARGLRGDIVVRAADGRVRLDDLDGSLRLDTQDGHSEVRGRFDQVEVETADGGIEIDALTGSRVRQAWALRSEDGGIDLRIPRDLAATIDARTQDGGLSVDLPVRLTGAVRRHQLIGDLNGGGEILRLRCADGSIRVGAID